MSCCFFSGHVSLSVLFVLYFTALFDDPLEPMEWNAVYLSSARLWLSSCFSVRPTPCSHTVFPRIIVGPGGERRLFFISYQRGGEGRQLFEEIRYPNQDLLFEYSWLIGQISWRTPPGTPTTVHTKCCTLYNLLVLVICISLVNLCTWLAVDTTQSNAVMYRYIQVAIYPQNSATNSLKVNVPDLGSAVFEKILSNSSSIR